MAAKRGRTKETIGVFAFVSQDYRELDYPLELWLNHNLNFFDQIALVKYGDFEIPKSDKVVIDVVETPPNGLKFYTVGKQRAQALLTTDWKILSDIDEFIFPAINLDECDKSKVHLLRCRHFWGNLQTEIAGGDYAATVPRVSYGDATVIEDGGKIRGRRGRVVGQFWHTNGVRNIAAFRKKYHLPQFEYCKYKEVRAWSDSYLRTIDVEGLPPVLKEEEKKFNTATFENVVKSGTLKDWLLMRCRGPRHAFRMTHDYIFGQLTRAT